MRYLILTIKDEVVSTGIGDSLAYFIELFEWATISPQRYDWVIVVDSVTSQVLHKHQGGSS